MAIIKKSEASKTKVTVTNYVYICDKCGHTDTSRSEHGTKACPKCDGGRMELVSTQSE